MEGREPKWICLKEWPINGVGLVWQVASWNWRRICIVWWSPHSWSLLHFFAFIQTGRAFIEFWLSVATAKMAGAFTARHKSQPHPTAFFADITIFFPFSFWHFFPLTLFLQFSSNRRSMYPCLAQDDGVWFQESGWMSRDTCCNSWGLASILIMTREAHADREQEGEPTTWVKVMANTADRDCVCEFSWVPGFRVPYPLANIHFSVWLPSYLFFG